MAIRYNKNLNQEINRTIKNFNQKIARLEKQNAELLPSKITKEQLKQDVNTRQQLYRKLKQLQRFSKRGSENVIQLQNGVRLTQYDLQNIKRERARVKMNITRELKRLETTKPKIFGKEQDVTYAHMGDTRYLQLKAKMNILNQDILSLDREKYNRYIALLNKTASQQNYEKSVFKESYFKMIEDLAYYSNYDKTKLDHIKERLFELKPNKFLELFNTDKSVKAIAEYYPTITNTEMNFQDLQEDLTSLFDNLYNNIDLIVENYGG